MSQTRQRRYRPPDAVRPASGLPSEILGGQRAPRRLQAIEEVLSRLPPDPYARLESEFPCFQWHVTDARLLGQVRLHSALGSTHRDQKIGRRRETKVIELSTNLEHEPWPVIVTVVVHELAHVILRHAVGDIDLETHHRQELDVWNAIRDWGFSFECDQAVFLLTHRVASARADYGWGSIPSNIASNLIKLPSDA